MLRKLKRKKIRSKGMQKVFLTLLISSMSHFAFAQVDLNRQILIPKKEMTLRNALYLVTNSGKEDFAYNSNVIPLNSMIVFEKDKYFLGDFLKLICDELNLTYQESNNTILLLPKIVSSELALRGVQLTATVLNDSGELLGGVTVTNKRTGQKAITNGDGEFSLKVMFEDIVVYSMIGYETKTEVLTFPYKAQVVLNKSTVQMDEVVVNSGFVNRRAESFTGSAVTIKKDELLRAGNQNILQSLKNIDPSFRITENLDLGSDPNRMPNVVMRGQSNMPDLTGTFSGNPNQPLFILDGFETTIQRIYDLDMNRVQSVTLLKDASAKAIYGAKAGNGVVIIETVQPQKGQLRLNYNGQIDIESPDLTGYNLMNAKEKLRWEKDHQMWYSPIPSINQQREVQYNKVYQDVYSRGVDTYWLSQPLRTGIGQRHNINMEGGDDYLRYNATFTYNKVTGAMKGSDRNTYNANTTLSYRYRNLLFRNSLEGSRNISNNSPYGSFSQYVSMNPYFSPYDGAGKLESVMGANTRFQASNPLYNAFLPQIDQTTYTQLIDNFYAEWDILKNLKLRGSVGYTYQRNGGDKFLPPGHTEFIGYNEENGLSNYKGRWTQAGGNSRSVESNISADYNFHFGKHLFFANGTFNLSDSKSNSNTVIAEGFGSDNVKDIAMASFYQRGGAPIGADNHIRSIGLIGMLNYTYDDRFLFDVNIRRSASSIYGANNRWSTLGAVGIGYNLHNEKFIKNLGIFQQFRLRGSAGYSGTQSADGFSTLATYQYVNETYDASKGLQLMALPNPNLSWQKVLDYNGALDLIMFKSKLSVRFDVYRKLTNNLVQDISAAPSNGFETFKANIGKSINTGRELTLRYQAFNNSENRSYFNISFTAAQNKNRINEINDAFKSFNDKNAAEVQQGGRIFNKPVTRFSEGQSITAIWAMQSLGIDPSTGQERFLDLQGNVLTTYDVNQIIIAGDTEPKVNGTFGFTGGYRGFTVSLTCSYRFGGKLFNGTLAERVENINGLTNLDRRVYDAWSKVGDLAIYRAPQVSSAETSLTYTQPTTRFVQRNDEVYFSAINIGYDITNKRFLKSLGLERLRTTFYTNELLRISSIQIERGRDYPFARNYSFSVQASF